jgi:hypothetical protein
MFLGYNRESQNNICGSSRYLNKEEEEEPYNILWIMDG